MTNILFALLEERKDARNSITITFTNIGNVLMTQNFMVELAKVGVHNWIVVSFDAESCEILGNYCYHDPTKNFNLDKISFFFVNAVYIILLIFKSSMGQSGIL